MAKPGLTRFILASMVILYHLNPAFAFGQFAVCAFFTLSGYWIVSMYESRYLHTVRPVVIFYVSRVWRLLPVFYVCTLFALAVELVLKIDVLATFHSLSPAGKAGYMISNLVLLGYNQLGFFILRPAWSLDIEMQFYLLFPILYLIVARGLSWVRVMTIVALVVSLLLPFVAADSWLTRTVLPYLLYFMTGILIYKLQYRFFRQTVSFCLYSFVFVTAAHIVFNTIFPESAITGGINFLKPYLLALFGTPVVMNSVYKKTDARDRFWGEMSFLVYLTHWGWHHVYKYSLARFPGPVPAVLSPVVYLAVTFGSAYLLYKFIDRPSEKIRHRFVAAQKKDGIAFKQQYGERHRYQ